MKKILLLTLLAVMAVIPAPARAHLMPCNTGEVMWAIAHNAGLVPVASGTMIDGADAVMVANAETGGWAILLVYPDGSVCAFADNGEGFRPGFEGYPEPKPEEAPS